MTKPATSREVREGLAVRKPAGRKEPGLGNPLPGMSVGAGMPTYEPARPK